MPNITKIKIPAFPPLYASTTPAPHNLPPKLSNISSNSDNPQSYAILTDETEAKPAKSKSVRNNIVTADEIGAFWGLFELLTQSINKFFSQISNTQQTTPIVSSPKISQPKLIQIKKVSTSTFFILKPRERSILNDVPVTLNPPCNIPASLPPLPPIQFAKNFIRPKKTTLDMLLDERDPELPSDENRLIDLLQEPVAKYNKLSKPKPLIANELQPTRLSLLRKNRKISKPGLPTIKNPTKIIERIM